jgi:hypothetical protein
MMRELWRDPFSEYSADDLPTNPYYAQRAQDELAFKRLRAQAAIDQNRADMSNPAFARRQRVADFDAMRDAELEDLELRGVPRAVAGRNVAIEEGLTEPMLFERPEMKAHRWNKFKEGLNLRANPMARRLDMQDAATAGLFGGAGRGVVDEYGQPTAAFGFLRNFLGLGDGEMPPGGGAAPGAAGTPGSATGPQAGKRVSLARVKELAARRGVTTEEFVAALSAAGYEVY